jgi:4-carboxymuconolactone decarboxylase
MFTKLLCAALGLAGLAGTAMMASRSTSAAAPPTTAAAASTASTPSTAGAATEMRPFRLPLLTPDELTPEQRVVADELTAQMGRPIPPGPFSLLLREPGVAEGALRIFSAYRNDSKLDRRYFELAVLTVAREWRAQFEWYAHEGAALKLGIDPEVVAAIKAGRRPHFARPDEKTVYDTIVELDRTHHLSPAAYARIVALLGDQQTLDLITAAGYYTMLAMTISAFDVQAPTPAPGRPLS